MEQIIENISATESGILAGRQAVAGKYLTFQLGTVSYGLEILKVQEIIGLMEITAVPKMPDYMRGVINLRGSVIPVVDLRKRFEMDVTADTEKTCVIVVQVGRDGELATFGVVIDEVSEVLDIAGNLIEAAPDLGANTDNSFLIGIGKIGKRVIMLLDVDEVLSLAERKKITKFQS